MKMTSTKEDPAAQIPTCPQSSAQTVFKYMTYTCILVILSCVPGFVAFRQYCHQQNYYVFSLSALAYVIAGFLVYFTVKYRYYALTRSFIAQLVNPKYKDEWEIDRKIDMLQKLSFDFMFYLCVTIYCYYEFRAQYWFPESAGGEGSCGQIYKDYPDWPVSKRKEIQNYFCFQLGIHSFSVYELIFFRKKNERKYYEWMLHHVVAATLIFFSLMCNEILIGMMILIIHDASDVFLSGSRFYMEAQLPKWMKNNYSKGITVGVLLSTWIYFRLALYPFCLINSIYENLPTPAQEWYQIYWEYFVLLAFTIVLVVMHTYWFIYMVRSVIALLSKKETFNLYDVHKKSS